MSEVSVLFVDDDPNILASLRRMLHPLRRTWDIQYASGGREALRMLAEHPFDVVVSDMRMPEMNGAELLAEIMKRQPKVIRIILSGHTEREMALQTINVAHHFLMKPCGYDELTSVIRRAVDLHSTFASPEMGELVGTIGPLPSAPVLYRAIIGELHSDDPDIERVVAIVRNDPPMTATVLRLVNSGFFGMCSRITEVRQAVEMLGIELLQSLAAANGVFALYRGADASVHTRLTERAVRLAFLARQFASAAGAPAAVIEGSSVAAILCDVGLLILHAQRLDLFRRLSADAPGDADIVATEHAVMGASHAQLGAFLLGLWSLEDSVVEAVAHHLAPSSAITGKGLTPLVFVHAADALLAQAGDCAVPAHPTLPDIDFLTSRGVSEHLPRWREIVDSQLRHQIAELS